MEKAQAKSSLAKPKINNNVKTELSKEHLKKLRNNAYSGTEEEDVVDHIAKINEGSDKITTWSEVVGRFFYEGNNELMDDTESSDEELKKSDCGNPRNSDADLFFKPYLDAQEKDNIYEIEKGSKHNQKYRGGNISKVNDIVLNNALDSDNIKDEQPNERVCRAKKFEVIKYSLGPNEE
ncbi:hypothetical protein Tco_1023789 [Tanacetum coccineum]